MTDKCFKCATIPGHKFKDCMSVKCRCSCVQQIYSIPANVHEEDMSEDTPSFLEISNQEVRQLPDFGNLIVKFTHVDKTQWIKKGIDKRTRQARKLRKKK